MKRCVIVSAADIKNYKKIKTYLDKDDFYVFCDAGLKHSKKLGVKPNLIVGDFDSYRKPLHFKSEIISLPREKDDTDTFYAVKECVKRGFTEFLLLGVIGNRMDHSLCNVSALLYLEERGLKAIMVDDYSEMQIVSREEKTVDDSFSYFSVMCFCGDISGVNISGAKYCLKEGTITTTFQYGSSNEVLPGQKAKISIKNGKAILIKIF